MINRNEEFARCKEGNLTLVLAAIKDGKIECRYRAAATSVEAVETDGCPARFNAKTPDGAEAIGCHRVIARLGATPPRKLVESRSASSSRTPIRPRSRSSPTPTNRTFPASTSSARWAAIR